MKASHTEKGNYICTILMFSQGINIGQNKGCSLLAMTHSQESDKAGQMKNMKAHIVNGTEKEDPVRQAFEPCKLILHKKIYYFTHL